MQLFVNSDQRRVQKLRGSADVAVLIVSSMGNGGCGMGYVDSWRLVQFIFG
jgi:hypothetical protein